MLRAREHDRIALQRLAQLVDDDLRLTARELAARAGRSGEEPSRGTREDFVYALVAGPRTTNRDDHGTRTELADGEAPARVYDTRAVP